MRTAFLMAAMIVCVPVGSGSLTHALEPTTQPMRYTGWNPKDVEGMRKKIAAEPDRAMLRMSFAEGLAREGKHEEALKQFLLCFDHAPEKDPPFIGLRSSFLVSDFKHLGDIYLPALEAMKQRRAAAAARVKVGDTSRDAVSDVVSISWALKDDFDLMEILNALPKRAIMDRIDVLEQLARGLWEKRKYKQLLTTGGVDEVLEQLAVVHRVYWESNARREREPAEVQALRWYSISRITRDLNWWYEAMVATGDARAGEIKRRILEAWPGKISLEQLADAEQRAKEP